MPEGSIDLADIDYTQPFDPNWTPEQDELPFDALDLDDEPNE